MITTVNYSCPMCGKAGEAKYDSEMVNNLDFWKSLLHCNRCADFKSRLRSLRERCKDATITQWQLKLDRQLTPELAAKIRAKVLQLTQSIARLTCDHWKVQTIWEPDFAEQILEFPDKAEFIVNHYANAIKEQAAQATQADFVSLKNKL